MSVRPSDSGKPPTPPALTKWPAAPSGFKKGEVEAWKVIGVAAMHLRTMSEADLPMAGRAAQIRARVDALLTGGNFKTLASMLKLEMDIYKQLGLTPQARRQVAPLKSGRKERTGYEEVD